MPKYTVTELRAFLPYMYSGTEGIYLPYFCCECCGAIHIEDHTKRGYFPHTHTREMQAYFGEDFSDKEIEWKGAWPGIFITTTDKGAQDMYAAGVLTKGQHLSDTITDGDITVTFNYVDA